MSTKIYNAYRMVDVPTLYELRKRMGRLRKTVQRALYEDYLKLIAQSCTTMIDRIACGDGIYASDDFDRSVYSKAIEDICVKRRKIKQTQERDPLYDFDCTLELIPIQDKILVMVFCERSSICKIIDRQKYLKYYGYWDNTDPDESCSEKEWDQRRIDWDKALPGIGVPSQNGFSVQLHQIFLRYPQLDDILRYVPAYKDRIEGTAFNRAWSRLTEKLKHQERDGWAACMRAHRELHDTEKGKKIIKRSEAFVSSKISKKITPDMLKQNLRIKRKRKKYASAG